MDFVAHLKRQLSFLERSCGAYDAGYHDEAIRLAQTMRVLLQKPARPKPGAGSLLQHLGAENIQLASTAGYTRAPGRFEPDTVLTMGMRTISSSGFSYTAPLGEGRPPRLVPVDVWWNQIIFKMGDTRITRGDLVKGAANKDGGSHVDAKLSNDYAALAATGAAGAFIYIDAEGSATSYPIDDAHFVAIRQMAYELLSSDELTSIARR